MDPRAHRYPAQQAMPSVATVEREVQLPGVPGEGITGKFAGCFIVLAIWWALMFYALAKRKRPVGQPERRPWKWVTKIRGMV